MNTYRRLKADPADWFSPDEVSKAKDYQRPLTYLRVASAIITLGSFLAIISMHAAPRLADALGVDAWPARLFLSLGLVMLVGEVLDLPLDLWREFSHEKRWGFSTQTPGRYVADLIKNLVLGVVLFGVLMVPLWALIRSTQAWWIAGWVVFLLFSVVFTFLGPVLILPLFNKITPLENPELADNLRELARSAGLSISDVQVMDASKRTRKDNAFFAGLGRTRRVVLFDNILEHPLQAIRTIVAHELGHWRKRHLVHGLVVGTLLSFALFALLRMVSTWDAVLDWAGVDSIADPASLPLVLLILGGGQVALGYIRAWHSRALERQADIEALEITQDGDGFQDMMRNLMTRNLADLAPSQLAYLRMDHPPAAERLQLAEAWRAAQPAGKG